ncbi:GPH family glycoside/pentoside/hexuronide:cation symporter [Sinobaca qinghaiensis]|uniref:GPH family glycoside/pentoside/hexuronide:cation symporter n=1 Tax=Sinobaca qinghaiensis TaxID=342944 RepID=A0A419V0C4_9BACL|nr:glycoside-pentoside-hexuronide (GPH):cation symporter [Sinobaca qinghaiensis]RKD71349.1 GPH family glycoside/pentoside/hexuronide:cation symporter [Sinobaca qinghaiensis]
MEAIRKEETKPQKQMNQREMPFKQLLGDGIGQFGMTLLGTLTAVLLFYYTDVVGISAGLVGTLLLVARFSDGFTDLFMGNVIDNTKSKHGKARPWILWMVFPAMIAAIALFNVPDIGSTGQAVYILVTNIIFFSICMTILTVAYFSLMALTTRNHHDRSLIGITRALFNVPGGMLMSAGLIPILAAFGGGQQTWTIAIIIISSIAVITLLITFKTSKEIVTSTERTEIERKMPYKEKVKILFKNKYLVKLLLAGVFINTLFNINTAAGVYYAIYIWEDVNLVAVIGGVTFLPLIFVLFLLPPIIKKFGKKQVIIVGSVMGIIGNMVRLIDPYSISVGLTGMLIVSIGLVPLIALIGPMINDTIEYGEWQSNVRMEATVNGFNSFVTKAGVGIGTAIVAWSLAFGGYAEGQATQPDLANHMIIAMNTYIPALLYVIMIISLARYDLYKIYPSIIADLEKRNNQTE